MTGHNFKIHRGISMMKRILVMAVELVFPGPPEREGHEVAQAAAASCDVSVAAFNAMRGSND